MKLTAFTDYSLRVLMLPGHEPGTASHHRARSSTAFDVSENHLIKVVHFLGKQGWLDNVRGKGGGLLLARPAKEICVGRVVRDTEGAAMPAECFSRRTEIQCADLGLLPPERRAGRSRRRLLRRARPLHARRHHAQPRRAGQASSSLRPLRSRCPRHVARRQGTIVTADPNTSPYPYSGPPAMRKPIEDALRRVVDPEVAHDHRRRRPRLWRHRRPATGCTSC